MASPPYTRSAKLSHSSHLARFDRPAATALSRWSEASKSLCDHVALPFGEPAGPAVAHELPLRFPKPLVGSSTLPSPTGYLLLK
jgi:hypothetical protein